MSARKRVVFAFGRRRERTKSVQLAVRAEAVTPSRQYLMAVGLMPYIPDDTVIRCIEDIMNGHRQFDGT